MRQAMRRARGGPSSPTRHRALYDLDCRFVSQDGIYDLGSPHTGHAIERRDHGGVAARTPAVTRSGGGRVSTVGVSDHVATTATGPR